MKTLSELIKEVPNLENYLKWNYGAIINLDSGKILDGWSGETRGGHVALFDLEKSKCLCIDNIVLKNYKPQL
jgi:hypothetical protein